MRILRWACELATDARVPRRVTVLATLLALKDSSLLDHADAPLVKSVARAVVSTWRTGPDPTTCHHEIKVDQGDQHDVHLP